MRKLAEVRDEHPAQFIRRRLGVSPISGRPLVGYTIKCACGFEKKVNENMRGAESFHREHIRDAWEAERNPRYTITDKGREAVAALKGKYAGRLPSVDEALASRAEDSDE